MSEKVQLGRHEVEVYAQRHAYITNKIGRKLGQVMSGAGDLSDPQALYEYALRDGAYGLLAGMMPNYGQRCPEYEFMGFGSQASYESGEYNEDEDNSPTPAQIITAFEVVARVNRFDVLKVLKGVIDPNLLKAQISVLLSEAMETRLTTTTSGGSVIEHSENAGSPASTSSSATTQTSPESEVSPTPDSTDSEGRLFSNA